MQIRTHRQWSPYLHTLLVWVLTCAHVFSQRPDSPGNQAGYVPIISGGAGYVHNVTGGGPTLEPQVNPVLLVPMSKSFLLESHVDFTGFFE